MFLEEIKCATLEGATLREVASRIRSGQLKEPCPTGVDAATLSSFHNIKDELTLLPDNDLIHRGTRLVIPHTLQARTLAITHEGHQGLVTTKQLLREKVWFSGTVERLAGMSSHHTHQERSSLKVSALPPGPLLHVSVDFWGPTPDEKYVVVIVAPCIDSSA